MRFHLCLFITLDHRNEDISIIRLWAWCNLKEAKPSKGLVWNQTQRNFCYVVFIKAGHRASTN